MLLLFAFVRFSFFVIIVFVMQIFQSIHIALDFFLFRFINKTKLQSAKQERFSVPLLNRSLNANIKECFSILIRDEISTRFSAFADLYFTILDLYQPVIIVPIVASFYLKAFVSSHNYDTL